LRIRNRKIGEIIFGEEIFRERVIFCNKKFSGEKSGFSLVIIIRNKKVYIRCVRDVR